MRTSTRHRQRSHERGLPWRKLRTLSLTAFEFQICFCSLTQGKIRKFLQGGSEIGGINPKSLGLVGLVFGDDLFQCCLDGRCILCVGRLDKFLYLFVEPVDIV